MSFKEFLNESKEENLDEAKKSVPDLGVKSLNGFEVGEEVAVFGRAKVIVYVGNIIRFQSSKGNEQPVIKPNKATSSSHLGEVAVDFSDVLHANVFKK